MSEDSAQDIQNRAQERRGGADTARVPVGLSERVEWAVWYSDDSWPIVPVGDEETAHWLATKWCELWNEQRGNRPLARVVSRTVTTMAWEDA